VDVVVIGISTGGPQALRHVLPQLPADFPVPVAVVLHMPVGYTQLYAQKLDELCDLHVVEARDGMPLVPGQIVIAQAGRHLVLKRINGGPVTTHLTLQPMDLVHRPAADVLFQSAAEVFGSRVLGVVMTGMGNDGTQGSAWIKSQGGTVLTESEQSSVIYGMPRSVVEAGLSDQQIPLSEMAEAIIERL
jgi:two-component system chemotaxis response regulator CheB